MSSVKSVLRDYGNGISPDDFAAELERVLRRRVIGDSRALSAHDREVLAVVGVPPEDFERQPDQTVVEAAADVLVQNSGALSVTVVAERLGRSANRIRGAIADGSLYGVKMGRTWLLPPWQFTEDAAPLPHLRKVIAAIPDGASAISVERLMTDPTDELYLAGAPVSPRQWLLVGQAAAPVVEMVEQLYWW